MAIWRDFLRVFMASEKIMMRSFERGLSVGEQLTTCAIYLDEGSYTGQWRMSEKGLQKHGSGVWKMTNCLHDSFVYTGRFEYDEMTTGRMHFEIPGVSKVYDGEFRKGRFEGYGALNHNELRYTGQFVDGQPDGLGKLTLPNGDYCEGGFSKGLPSGVGLQVIHASVHTEGLTYMGGFVEGVRHGHGIAKYGDRAVYVGPFEKDERCGRGVMFFNDQSASIYGVWFEDQVTGVCETISVVSGAIEYYNGMIVEDNRHGTGKLVTEDMIYEGEFGDGVYAGSGKISKLSGEVIYEGSWAQGKPHGHGRETLHGATYTGSFMNSHKQGMGCIVYQDGSVYRGMWNEDEREGDGFFISAAGDTFSGRWLEDNRHGAGVYTDTGGVRYEGTWDNDLLHGRCVTISNNGSRKGGVWRLGVKVS